jgi:hypothetical protein
MELCGMSESIIFADDLARTLEVSEEEVYEMARLGSLPFAVSTAAPRRLFIEARDLSTWRAALGTASARLSSRRRHQGAPRREHYLP